MFTRKFKSIAGTYITKFLAIYGTIWLIINSFTNLNWGKVPEQYQGKSYYILLFVSTIVAYFCVRNKNKVCFKINGITITIQENDLFSAKGPKVIPVNEFFDSCIGEQVSANSVHGQFILKKLDGKSDLFNKLVSEALSKKTSVDVFGKERPNHRYPIGTTAYLENIKGENYFLIAVAKTDIATSKAKATKEDYIVALDGLWKSVYQHSNGDSINLPVIGNGLSNISPDPQFLIRLILFSIAYQNEIPTRKICIITTKDQAKDIDLSSIKREWVKE